MKSKTIVFAALLIAAAMAFLAPRQAKADVTFSYFYENLVPLGDWVDVDQYGYCWVPRGVAPDWRPYTDGYWTYTDAGWTWVSYEEFGSITYHYGRWVRLEEVGWVWKPDYRWGPAWVSWRQSDNYVGWAPLPPDVSFDDDAGVGVWVDRDYDIGPSAYVFCDTRYFGAPVLRNVIVPVRRNVEILDVTVNITNITVINRRDYGRLVFNGGPNYLWVSERCERPIDRLELVLRTDGDWIHRGRPELSRHSGLQLFINAPIIVPPREVHFAPPHVVREIRAPRIDRGWGAVGDPRERERIHQRYQEQTRGLTQKTAPAYRVNESEVQSFIHQPRPSPSSGPRGSRQPGVPQQQQPSVQPQRTQPSVQPVQPTSRPETAPVQPTVRPQQTQPSAQPVQPTSRPETAPVQPTVRPQQTQPSAQPVQPTSRPETTPVQPTVRPQRTQPSVQPVQPASRPETTPVQPTVRPQRTQPSVQPVQPASRPETTPVQPTVRPQRTQPSVQPVQPTVQPQRHSVDGDRNQRIQRPEATPRVQAVQPVQPVQRTEPAQRPQEKERGQSRQERQPQVQDSTRAVRGGQPQQSPSSSRDKDKDRKRDRSNDPTVQ